MKKILLGLVLLTFLAGGGGAAWLFLLPGSAPEDAAPAPAAKASFVDLPVMAVPVIRADGSIRTFLVELTLELPDRSAVDGVTALMPRISDGLLVTLHELLGRRFVEESGYDQTIIKQHLTRVVRQIAGESQIAGVLIRNFDEFRRG